MPRKKKQDIRVNSNESLEGLIQETYNDACLQISDSQRTINELSASIPPTDVDDLTKIVKEKGNLLKIKDSAIRIKLEIAKLQNDIIKNSGDIETAVNQRSNGTASLSDFKTIRQMFVDDKKNSNTNE